MMKHKSYFEISATDDYNLGFLTGKSLKTSIKKIFADYNEVISSKTTQNSDYIDEQIKQIAKIFPNYYAQLEGYCDATEISIKKLLTYIYFYNEICEDGEKTDKCTTIINPDGKIFVHVEDGSLKSKNELCLLRTKFNKTEKLEAVYNGFLAGDAFGYSSNGFVYSMNSLYSKFDNKGGFSRVFINKYLSDGIDINDIKKRAKDLQELDIRDSFSYNVLDFDGRFINIEFATNKISIMEPKLPFGRANLFISELAQYEDKNLVKHQANKYGLNSAYNRSLYANKIAKQNLPGGHIMKLIKEKENPIVYDYTDAVFITDLAQKAAYILLMSDKDKGWVMYDI